MLTHAEKVLKIQEIILGAHKTGTQLSLRKQSTNTTRKSDKNATKGASIDLEPLSEILDVNTEARWVDVEPRVPMDKLVAATLHFNLLPYVVPEFPGITVGGAIQGGALESSSFCHGQLNDTVLEIEVVLGNGSVIVATQTNEYRDLFWGLSTSYGSLGIITRVRLPLISARPYIEVQMTLFKTTESCLDAIVHTPTTVRVDFLEGIVFSPTKSVMLQGRFVEKPETTTQRLSRNIDPWYYHLIKKKIKSGQFKITIPTQDYLFRYDKGAFWMGEHLFPYFHLPSNALTRFFFAPFLRTRKLYEGLHALGLQENFVIQDLYMDVEEAPELLTYNEHHSKIFPLWICPIRSSDTPQKLSAHFRNTASTLLINIGIYGTPTKNNAGSVTIELEKRIAKSKSRKMLYADTHFSHDTFWQLYDQRWYNTLRKKYHAQLFKDVYEKVRTKSTINNASQSRALAQLIKESLRGKNIVWW